MSERCNTLISNPEIKERELYSKKGLRKYYEGFAGKIDPNNQVQTTPLYKVYKDDKRLRK